MAATIELIHPTARVHSSARIDESARVGAGCVIEPEVFVGPGCVVGEGTRLRLRSVLVEHTKLGEQNDVHPYVVLGGDPQDKSFDPERRGELVIGDRNIFREGVTINRGNWNGPATRVGSGCYLMSQAHIGHNASIGDNVIMANGSSLAGHARVGSGCVLSACCAVHQFVDVGDGVMFRGGAMVSMHVPPFVITAGENFVAGLNAVGLRRNPGMTVRDREEIKRVFRALFRERGASSLSASLSALSESEWGPGASRFLEFVRFALAQEKPRNRGIVGGRKMKIRTRSFVSSLADTSSIEA